MVVAHELVAPMVRRSRHAGLVGRHLAQRELRQLDGLPHRQRMAARAQYRRRRARRGLPRDEHRRAGGRAADPPADHARTAKSTRLRQHHLWQGRPGRGDDRRLSRRREVQARAFGFTSSATPMAMRRRSNSSSRSPTPRRTRGPDGVARALSTSRACRWSTSAATDRKLVATQSRYAFLGSSAAAPSVDDSALHARRARRRSAPARQERDDPRCAGTGAIMPNVGGTGYYRFDLAPEDWKALIADFGRSCRRAKRSRPPTVCGPRSVPAKRPRGR